MGLNNLPAGVGGQPDVLLRNLQQGQSLNWDSTVGKWVNGLEFINAPTISSPVTGDTVQAGAAVSLTCSAFVGASGMNLVHFDNDWEVATDILFQNVFYGLYNQTASATTVSATIPVGYAQGFIRVRQNTVDRKGIWSAPVSVTLRQIQTFNTSGDFVVPANTNTVIAHLVGGGAGAPISSLGGGAGGRVTASSSVSVTPSATITVTVGAGASGSSAGGTTTFSTANAVGGNAGGASAGGSSTFAGGNGGNAVGGGGGGAGAVGNSAGGSVNGGSTANGGNGGAGVLMTVDGATRGGGGGGGSNNSSNSLYAHNGGSGGSGGGTSGITGGSSGSGTPSPRFANTPSAGTGGGAGGNWGGGSVSASTGGNGIAILTWTF